MEELYKEAIKPHQIVNGSKLIAVYLIGDRVKFIDSLNFFPMALSNFPKSFGLTELKKGFFPHFFNTTCTGRKAEICQLSATDETGLNIFSNYILPSGNVSNGASRVNKLSARTINGKRRLYKENQPVETVTLDQALQKFLTFLGNVKYPVNSEFVIILIGHNASVFDTPILLRESNTEFHSKLRQLNVCFADSQILVKQLIKEKHPALQVPSAVSANQTSLVFTDNSFRKILTPMILWRMQKHYEK